MVDRWKRKIIPTICAKEFEVNGKTEERIIRRGQC